MKGIGEQDHDQENTGTEKRQRLKEPRRTFTLLSMCRRGMRTTYPYKVGDHVLLIGIENMPGHCAVVTRDGRIVWGYHSQDFRKLTVDET
jgi:hypothetical protein